MLHNLLTRTLPVTMLLLFGGSPLAFAAQDTYQVDPDHSFVLFRAGHFGVGAVYGRFRKISGDFTFDQKKPPKSKVRIEIDASSVYTGNKKRDQHLTGPDFLNAKQFGKIIFQSVTVKKSGRRLRVSGKLQLHGVTKPVTVTMTHLGSGKDPMGNQRAGFEGEFTIKRGDFGITAMTGLVGGEVKLIVAGDGGLKK